jgi:DnaK suppressor protein
VKNQIVTDRLLKIRDHLNNQINNLTIAVEASGDFCDRGQASQEKSQNIALQRVLRERLADVESAIKRTTDGTYGICVDCGGQISPGRLEAKLETSRCIECEIKASQKLMGIKTAPLLKLRINARGTVLPRIVTALAQ